MVGQRCHQQSQLREWKSENIFSIEKSRQCSSWLLELNKSSKLHDEYSMFFDETNSSLLYKGLIFCWSKCPARQSTIAEFVALLRSHLALLEGLVNVECKYKAFGGTS